jgi:hypothetical protein
MSYLDTFYNSYFEEKDEFIQVMEKELLLDKVDFVVNGYVVIECMHPYNLVKATLLSGKGKKKVDDYINLSNDNFGDKMTVEDDINAIDNNYIFNEESMQGYEDDVEMEVESHKDAIPLQGIQLGKVTADEEESNKLTRARF